MEMCNVIAAIIAFFCFPLIIFIYNQLLHERDFNNAIFNNLSSRISNIDHKLLTINENINDYKMYMVEISFNFNKTVNEILNRSYHFKYALDELEKSVKKCSINTSKIHHKLTEITYEVSYLKFKVSSEETRHIQLSMQFEDISNKWNLNLKGFDNITKHIEQLFQDLKDISLSINNSRNETKSIINKYESCVNSMNSINKENKYVQILNEKLISTENTGSVLLQSSYVERNDEYNNTSNNNNNISDNNNNNNNNNDNNNNSNNNNNNDNSNNDIALMVSIPLEDYAVQSTGCKILRNMTAKTYFPFQYRFDIYIRKLMENFGFSNLIHYIPEWTGESIYRKLHMDELSQSPYKAIQTDIYPGSCWSMKGSRGNLTLQLTDEIVVSSVSIDHISSQDVADIGTSPKQFEVYSCDIMRGTDCLLTTGVLNVSNQHNIVQNFPVTSLNKCASLPSKVIKLVILSNYGNSNYTCVYRFRIHSS